MVLKWVLQKGGEYGGGGKDSFLVSREPSALGEIILNC